MRPLGRPARQAILFWIVDLQRQTHEGPHNTIANRCHMQPQLVPSGDALLGHIVHNNQDIIARQCSVVHGSREAKSDEKAIDGTCSRWFCERPECEWKYDHADAVERIDHTETEHETLVCLCEESFFGSENALDDEKRAADREESWDYWRPA